MQCSGSGWFGVFSPIQIWVLKVRIRPFINLCDLNDGFFNKFLKEPDQKGHDMKYNFFFYFYPSFRTCFSRIRVRIFPDRIRIFGRSGSGLRKKHCSAVCSGIFFNWWGGEATPLLPPIPGSAPGSKLILKKTLFSRSTDDWLKDLERANRMRKHREKMKQADQKQQQTSTAEQIFHSYSSQQQEAYRKFEK